MSLNKIYNVSVKFILIGFIVFQLICLITGSHSLVLERKTDMATKCIYDLAIGENPYNADWIYNLEAKPVNYYESGFFHVLPAVLLVKLGLSVRVAAAAVHVAYILLAMTFAYLCVYELTKNRNLALFGVVMSYYILDAGQASLVRPDNLCRAIILIISYIMIKVYRDKEQGGHYKIREWLLAFLLVLQGFLKIHYASILVAVYIVFLLNWKNKRWIWFTIKGIVVTIAFVAICQICFPTFFSTFGVRVLEMLFMNAAGGSTADMLQKWLDLLAIYPILFLILVIGSIIYIKKWRNLYKDNVVAFLFVNILVNVAGLCFMGKWPGNGLTYYNVMLMGTVLLAACYFLQSFKENLAAWGVLAEVIVIVLIVASVVICFYRYSDVRIKAWKVDTSNKDKIIEFFGQCDPEDVLLVSNSYIAFELGWYQWDYGDQIYIPNNIGTSPNWNFLFPYTNDYRQRMVDYCGYMVDKVRNKEYKYIVNGDDRGFGVKLGYEDVFYEILRENYEVSDVMGVRCYVPK